MTRSFQTNALSTGPERLQTRSVHLQCYTKKFCRRMAPSIMPRSRLLLSLILLCYSLVACATHRYNICLATRADNGSTPNIFTRTLLKFKPLPSTSQDPEVCVRISGSDERAEIPSGGQQTVCAGCAETTNCATTLVVTGMLAIIFPILNRGSDAEITRPSAWSTSLTDCAVSLDV